MRVPWLMRFNGRAPPYRSCPPGLSAPRAMGRFTSRSRRCGGHVGRERGECIDFRIWDFSPSNLTPPRDQIGPRLVFLSDRTTARLSVDLDTESFDAMSRIDRLLRANDLLADET